jgi:hypothetical protein
MIARHEASSEDAGIWPALFFLPPIVYAFIYFGYNLTSVLALVLLLAVVALAFWMLRRRLPGDIGVAVSVLIAGICALDAVFLASAGEVVLAWWAIAGFALTLVLQRFIPGT